MLLIHDFGKFFIMNIEPSTLYSALIQGLGSEFKV